MWVNTTNGAVRTPCEGMLLRETDDGRAVVRLHYTANPTLTPEKIKEIRKGYTNEARWRKEMEIEYDALEGMRVYQEFDPTIHVIDHSAIPDRLCRFMAIDPHPRTPHAMLWVGVDRWSDWYVYRELWPSKVYGVPVTLRDTDDEATYSVKEYCEAAAALEGNRIEWRYPETDDEEGIYRHNREGEKIVMRFMDQAGKAFRATGEDATVHESYADRYRRFGIECYDPDKRHKAGEDAIRQLLKPRKHDVLGTWPRLHISKKCPEAILEFTKLRYKLTKRINEERELKQEGVEYRCHMLDLLRYLATSPHVYYTARSESAEFHS